MKTLVLWTLLGSVVLSFITECYVDGTTSRSTPALQNSATSSVTETTTQVSTSASSPSTKPTTLSTTSSTSSPSSSTTHKPNTTTTSIITPKSTSAVNSKTPTTSTSKPAMISTTPTPAVTTNNPTSTTSSTTAPRDINNISSTTQTTNGKTKLSTTLETTTNIPTTTEIPTTESPAKTADRSTESKKITETVTKPTFKSIVTNTSEPTMNTSGTTISNHLLKSPSINESTSGNSDHSALKTSTEDTALLSTTPFVSSTQQKLNTSNKPNTSGNINKPQKGQGALTAAVISICLVVFLVLLGLTILHIRRRKSSTIRHLRLTNDEDDDFILDMEDIRTHEPTFTYK